MKKNKPSYCFTSFSYTPFAKNLQIYLMLWPVWWILGVEQILFPIFVFFEMTRYLFFAKARFKINLPLILTFLMALWWMIPFFWVPQSEYDRFARSIVTIWSQFFMLLLLLNNVKGEREWEYVIKGLDYLTTYIAFSGLFFVTGIWRGNFTSVIGNFLPSTLVTTSSFFESMVYRSFGSEQIVSALFNYRVSGLSLKYGSLGTLVVVLLPFVFWKLRLALTKQEFIFRVFLIVSLLMTLIHTETRTAYIALLVGFIVLVVLKFDLLHKQNTLFSFSIIAILILFLLFLIFKKSMIAEIFQNFFVDWRSGSWNVRIYIYRETLKLFSQHFFAGWGQTVKIVGLRSVFSAGSHSSYLGILFQHGIIGLVLYLGFWVTIWQRLIWGLRVRWGTNNLRYFWPSSVVAMFSFAIREIVTNWWWDQLVAIVVWTMWGLIFIAPHFYQSEKTEICLS